MTRVSLASTTRTLTPASNTTPQGGSVGVTHSVRLPVSLGVTGCHSTTATKASSEGPAPDAPGRVRRGEQTAVVLAPEGVALRAVDSVLRAELIRLLADALVADFIEGTDADGQFPLGNEP
jgi:hypothetical protein